MLELLILSLWVLCRLLGVLIFVRALLSWFSIRPDHPVLRALDWITDPIMDPLRRIVPQTGGVDFTPMVAIVILVWVIPWLLEILLDALNASS